MMQPVLQSTIQVIPAADLQEKPIRIGTTTELAIFPRGADFESRDFLARVSTATLTQGGDFTQFDGYSRILALVEGEGMDLTIAGNKHAIVEPYRPIRFLGDVSAHSELRGGAIRDFNVIFRPEVDAEARHVALGEVFAQLDLSSFGGLAEGSTRVDVLWSPDAALEVEAGRSSVSLNAGDVLILQHGRAEMSVLARAQSGTANAMFVNLRLPIL